ncbi:DUF5753 domain-containing protein [Nocardia cyriacigeorgica]|nr:DUF5753 domain-containing protein [Nocardia cyriacigeorgica]MBF6499272.1 hypothetical protein [Nocardia cyriacigeorgica]
MRQYRQMIVTRKRQPVEVDVVLHESVLRRTIGSAKATGIQLKRLADLSTRPNVTLRVLPNNAGVPGGHSVGQFTILHFGTNRAGEPVEPPVVYVPGIVGDMYFEKPKDVHRYHMAYKAFQDRSLDAVDSRGLLRQVAKEFLQ